MQFFRVFWLLLHPYDKKLADYIRQLSHSHGPRLQPSGANAHVYEALCERDVTARRRFYRHRPAHIVLHRSRYLHSDEAKHPESMDAAMGEWIRHSRNNVSRVLQFHNVSYSIRKGWVEHCFRAGHDEGNAAD